jgi:hypothetical protein
MTQEENIRAYRVRSPGGLLYKCVNKRRAVLPWCHGVGRDINVQCVLIKEMIIIVDHYTLAVRNRR